MNPTRGQGQSLNAISADETYLSRCAKKNAILSSSFLPLRTLMLSRSAQLSCIRGKSVPPECAQEYRDCLFLFTCEEQYYDF